MVVDAPDSEATKIVTRWEAELQGQLIDDGAGGVLELRTESSFHQCDLDMLSGTDASVIAQRLVTSVEQSVMLSPS